MKNKRIKIIENLKQEGLEIDEINYGKVLACSMYDTTIKYFFKILIYAIFFEAELIVQNKEAEILLEYSLKYKKRKDLDSMFKKMKKICEKISKPGIIYINPKLCISKIPFKFLLKEKKIKLKIFDKIKIFLLIIFYKNLKEKLDKEFKEINNKIFISYFDGHNFDNLCAQFFKNKNIKTVTLQHGQFRVVKKEFQNAESEAYLNFISDYMFIWGEKTLKEFEKIGYDDKKFKIVGSLKNFKLKDDINACTKKNFGIILDGKINYDSNIELIKIGKKLAKNRKLNYYIRVHPNDSIKNYKQYLDENFQVFDRKNYYEEVKFSLLHMTGTYIEALSYRHPIFVFNDLIQEEIFIEDFNSFKSYEELQSKLDNYYLDSLKFLKKIEDLYREFNKFENIEEKYIMEIRSILEGD